jgi:hypothetical protein
MRSSIRTTFLQLRRDIVAAVLLIAGLLPLGAQAATQCFNQNAPAPLEACVKDDGSPAVWVAQPNGRHYQYFGEYAFGSILWLDGANSARSYGSEYSSYFNLWTPVSNTLTGTGSSADPFVIATVIQLGVTGVQVTQRLTYVNGDRWLRKSWVIQNNGPTTYRDLRFFHGGDTYFGGDDSARSWFDPINYMVYLTNSSFENSGFMGFYPNPATPAAHYFAGGYSVGNMQASSTARLSDTADASYRDAGYQLEWNRASLAPGETWTIEAFETWSAPGATQVLAPASDYVTEASTTVRKTFKVHNLTGSPATASLAVTASGAGWTATLPEGTTIELNALQVREVPVDIAVPAGVLTGDVSDITLEATTGALTASGATRLTVQMLDIEIAPTTLDFGTVIVGDTKDLVVTLTNGAAAAPVQIGTIAGSNGLAAPWSITSNTCSGQTINAGGTCSLTVRYAPTAAATDASDSFDWPLVSPLLTTRTITVRGSAVSDHTVTATAGTYGSISPASASVAHGQTQQFTVTPQAGASIVSVSGCGGSLSGNTYTTGAITSACTVSATFALNSYAVTASTAGSGTISPDTRTVEHGSTTNFTVTPAVGHNIVSVTGCGGSLSGNTYTTGTITGACSVAATFAINTYAVTATAGANGSITPSTRSANHGSTTTFTVTPNTGYHIESVTGCGGSLSGNTYTTGAITGACAVNASFAINNYTVTATAGDNGTITPSTRSVSHGSTTTFTVTPNTGYHIESVTGCGGTLSGNTYTTGAITGACAVNASFAINNYTVTATAGDNGTITPNTQAVDYGGTATFTVTPADGYHIESVTGCGGKLNGNTYTTAPATGACAVNASFAINRYTVTATAGDHGAITPSTQTVEHGATATFTVIPETGFSIASISGCDGTLSGNTYTTAPVTAACTVNVSFDHTLPVFDASVSQPIDLSAHALSTELPASAYPQAFDYSGAPLEVTLMGGQSRYLPGEHTLTWRAVDSRGIAATVQQVLRVSPIVSAGKDVALGLRQGDSGSFKVVLNGPSPVYPFEVAYSVSNTASYHDLADGIVRFEQGEIEKDVYFAIVGTPPAGTPTQQVQISLDPQANVGERHSLNVTLSVDNLAPLVTLRASQGGEVRPAVGRQNGPVTIVADIIDPNSADTHAVQWNTPQGASFTANGAQLTLQPQSLATGVHRFEAIVTDNGSPAASSRAAIEIVIAEQAPELPDGAAGWLDNGLPNHPNYSLPMSNVLPERAGELHHYLVEADPGVTLALGTVAQLAGDHQAEVQLNRSAGIEPDTIANVGGYFDFVVSDLPQLGQSVSIVLPQRAAIPAQAVYRKYDPRARKWFTFVENATNTIASAPGQPGQCPPPSSTAYRAGLNVGDWCVRLTIEDGGPNDIDGERNGAVSDPGGVAATSSVVVTSKSGGGGSFDLVFVVLGALLWFVRRNPRALFAFALLPLAGIASAHERSSWYVAADLFQARSGTSDAALNAALQQPGGNITTTIAGEHRTAWRVRGGYELGNGLALEIGYTDLGDVRTTIAGTVVDIEELLATANAAHPHSAQGIEASAVGRYALNEIASLHARVGVWHWESDNMARSLGGEFNARDRVGTDVLYGLGAQVSVYKQWSVDLDWACYQVDRERIKTFGAGVTWRF